MIKILDKSGENAITAEFVSLRWERIFLFMEIKIVNNGGKKSDKPLDFYMVDHVNELIIDKDDYFEAKSKLKIIGEKDGIYTLRLNVTNAGNNLCIPLGTYTLSICRENEFLANCEVPLTAVDSLEISSKNFLYGNRARVFTVTFFAIDKGGKTLLQIHVLASVKCSIDFVNYLKLGRSFSNFSAQIIAHIKNAKVYLRRLYKIRRKRYEKKEHKKKTVLFMSEQNDALRANLQAVIDRLVARGEDKDINILTSAREATSGGQSGRSWANLIKKLAVSDIVFLDDHAPVLDWLMLSKKTKIVQLWHAGAGFKSSGYSRWGRFGCPSPNSCHRQYAYGIAGSKEIAPFFSEVWGISDEQVLPTGMPRMDEFLDENYRKEKTKEIYEQFPICKDKKVIMFAPTYRGKGRKDADYPYELIDFDKLYEICGDEYIVLFKMHPWTLEPVPIPKKYSDKFIDATTYKNINDLFYFTDLLITDYSSNIFEYSLMRKPMLFFAFDKASYSFLRGFHRDYEESAPGKVCYNFPDLLKAIKEQDFEYEKVEQYIDHHFDYIDSNASDRVIDWIIKDDMPKYIVDAIQKLKDEHKRLKELDFSFMIEKVKKIGEEEV